MKLVGQYVVLFAVSVVFFGLALFLPAGTFHYWQAWVYLAVFVTTTLFPSLHLAMKHPAALQRRMKGGPTAETRPVQRVVMVATIAAVVLQLVVSALDHRFGWSSVPTPVVIGGAVLVGVGLLLAQFVILQNGHAAATITVEADQPLVSTGLYGVVRHPMYLGAAVALSARIADEEEMLTAELAGYGEYTRRVRYRMVPRIW